MVRIVAMAFVLCVGSGVWAGQTKDKTPPPADSAPNIIIEVVGQAEGQARIKAIVDVLEVQDKQKREMIKKLWETRKVDLLVTEAQDKKEQNLERLKQIKMLEEKLQQLLKEVPGLPKPEQPKRFGPGGGGSGGLPPATQSKPKNFEWKLDGLIQNQFMVQSKAGSHPIPLSRATYHLPKEKAEALVALLKEFKAPVMETKIEGNKLTVTTSPEAQKAVGQFVEQMSPMAPAHPIILQFQLEKPKAEKKVK